MYPYFISLILKLWTVGFKKKSLRRRINVSFYYFSLTDLNVIVKNIWSRMNILFCYFSLMVLISILLFPVPHRIWYKKITLLLLYRQSWNCYIKKYIKPWNKIIYNLFQNYKLSLVSVSFLNFYPSNVPSWVFIL